MSEQRPPTPRPMPEAVLCPYCGHVSPTIDQCEVCHGHFDPLSRQATQNQMGPWVVRDPRNPYAPGCSYETLRRLIERGKVGPQSVIRGPTTRQFWTFANRAASIANLFGVCHNCRDRVRPDDFMCHACGASFSPETDRQHLGLAPVRMLPGEATPARVAASAIPHVHADQDSRDGSDQTPAAGERAIESSSEAVRSHRTSSRWLAIILLGVALVGVGVTVWLLTPPLREQPKLDSPIPPEASSNRSAPIPAPDSNPIAAITGATESGTQPSEPSSDEGGFTPPEPTDDVESNDASREADAKTIPPFLSEFAQLLTNSNPDAAKQAETLLESGIVPMWDDSGLKDLLHRRSKTNGLTQLP